MKYFTFLYSRCSLFISVSWNRSLSTDTSVITHTCVYRDELDLLVSVDSPLKLYSKQRGWSNSIDVEVSGRKDFSLFRCRGVRVTFVSIYVTSLGSWNKKKIKVDNKIYLPHVHILIMYSYNLGSALGSHGLSIIKLYMRGRKGWSSEVTDNKGPYTSTHKLHIEGEYWLLYIVNRKTKT